MITAQQIDEKLSSGKSPGGRYCNFIPLDDNWGIKVYSSLSKCRKCFEFQQFLSRHDLAPKVGDTIFRVGGYSCYATQIAKVPAEIMGGGDDNQFDAVRETTKAISDEIQILQDKVYELGYTWDDGWSANVGYIDGELVIVDCDPEDFWEIK